MVWIEGVVYIKGEINMNFISSMRKYVEDLSI